MHPNLLTDEDLEELTGRARKSEQCRALDEEGIFYVKRADGRPRTTWFHVNNPKHLRTPILEEEPDFSSFGVD